MRDSMNTSPLNWHKMQKISLFCQDLFLQKTFGSKVSTCIGEFFLNKNAIISECVEKSALWIRGSLNIPYIRD